MMINAHRLAALTAVAQTGSVSGAARKLHYGQSTLTHHLQRLEAETGAVLLQRVGRGVRLTPEGRLLAEHGAEISRILQRAQADLDAMTALQTSRVRMAVFPSATSSLIPLLMARLAVDAPGLRLDLVEAEPPEAAALLRSGEVDAALSFAYPGDRPAPQFVVAELFEDPLLLVVPVEDASASVADHVDSRWITGCESCRKELMQMCAEAGFAPDIGLATDDYTAVIALVGAGFGVSILPRLALAASNTSRLRLIPLPGRSRRIQLHSYGEPPMPSGLTHLSRQMMLVADDWTAGGSA